MNKILKNTTASAIFIPDTGISITPFATYDITESELLLWVASLDIIPLVTAGTIVVNDGISDLTASDGIRFLQYPDRITLQQVGLDITKVVTTINITGNATVTDNTNGVATIDILSAAKEYLREVTMVMYPFGPVNTTSDLLFEADPVNDTIRFLTEEII